MRYKKLFLISKKNMDHNNFINVQKLIEINVIDLEIIN